MTKPLHIFRAGRHTAHSGQSFEFSEAEVEGIATAYNPALHEAPIVVGHPRTDAPAYGWVKRLRAEGAELFAEPDQVEPAFAEMVRAGRFKRISASFYPPQSAANPTPGTYYLKHVGFLGAQPPAVKGLKAAEFAEDAEAVTLEIAFSEEGAPAASFADTLKGAIAAVLSWARTPAGQEALRDATGAPETTQIPFAEPQKGETAMSGKDTQTPEDRQAALDARAAALEAKEAAFAEALSKTRRAEDAALVEALVKDGRIAPGLKDEMAAFMESLDAQDEVAFAEGKSASPRAWFRDLLSKQTKPLIDFSERAGGDALPQVKGPDDITAAAKRLIKDAEAEGRTLSFAEAARQIEETMESDNG
ncbi:hypothetical protein KZZ08_17230 [Roseovarius mucosus]|uniref:Mu-like prophage I protein n=1 Tax=Roseovarius mucosus TaxID=215743 RepID=A0A1V0RTL1_9RHOB|nr:hypothetical protein [Roseovarius mucosus]ARE84952.1 hypothetical protein ROSMUCSMR3_03498 [Roseovarius mucosus]MBW4975376.1 hypothetical protein [Roseovarius mucosus]